jgi:hypothetical protein
VRYGTAHYDSSTVRKNKTGTLGQGSNWRERGEEGGVCGGGRQEQTEWTSREQGPWLVQQGGYWRRQASFGEGSRLKIQQSVAHGLALYPTNSNWCGAMGEGGTEGVG